LLLTVRVVLRALKVLQGLRDFKDVKALQVALGVVQKGPREM
jgi:hypothetical protein